MNRFRVEDDVLLPGYFVREVSVKCPSSKGGKEEKSGFILINFQQIEDNWKCERGLDKPYEQGVEKDLVRTP